MKIKLEHFRWFKNKPIVTEFEGTYKEWETLLKKHSLLIFPESIESELSDTWNIAKSYTNLKNLHNLYSTEHLIKLKILSLLVECDRYIKVALYGAENIEESLDIDPGSKIECRLQGLDRLKENLKLLIENNRLMLKKEDKFKDFSKRFKEIERVWNGLTREEENNIQKMRIIVINEKHFKLCLDKLRDIKREIIKLLNIRGLKFFPSKEIVKRKRDINKKTIRKKKKKKRK